MLKTNLQTAQNKYIKVILKLHPRTHLEAVHFKKVNFLKVEQRVGWIKLAMVHKIVHKSAPPYLEVLLNPVRAVHSHNTRGSQSNFIPLKCKTNFGKNTFSYTAICLWNELPTSLKLISNERSFKSNLKIYMNNWTNVSYYSCCCCFYILFLCLVTIFIYRQGNVLSFLSCNHFYLPSG